MHGFLKRQRKRKRNLKPNFGPPKPKIKPNNFKQKKKLTKAQKEELTEFGKQMKELKQSIDLEKKIKSMEQHSDECS